MKRIGIILGTVLCGCILQTAKAETISWHVDGSTYNTTTCTAGGDVNAPVTPTAPAGYTFVGWNAEPFDFSTLNPNTQGTAGTVDATNQTWMAEFSYGSIYGDALCSESVGTYLKSGNPSNTNGKNCWCRVTGYKPSGENTVYYSNTVLPWGYEGYTYNYVSDCKNVNGGCMSRCAAHSSQYDSAPTFRRVLFGLQ